MITSIFDFLEHWAVVQPHKLLFEFRDRHGEPRERYTYQSFHERIESLAAHLMDSPGLSPGDRVLLAYPAGLDGIAALLACARAGLVGVPVALPKGGDDPAMRRLRAIGNDCEATALLSNSANSHRLRQFTALRATTATWPLLNTDDFAGGPIYPTCSHHNEVLFLQYTSGSTGRPRGVIVSHNNVVANARATLDHMPGIGVSWLPQHHDMGLIGYYLFPIVFGGTTYGLAPVDFLRRPARWLRMLSDVRATHTSSPNFGYEYCLRDGKIRENELEGVDLSCLRVMMNAAEPVRPQTARKFYRRFAQYGLREAAFTNAYGLAENTLTVSHGGRQTLRVDRQALNARRVLIVEHGGGCETLEFASCGAPASGVKVCICDPDRGHPLGDLLVGEVCVGGASLTRGYWSNDKIMRRMFRYIGDDDCGVTRFIHTGDLGFTYSGELYVCGRIKELIIIGGANFFPGDLEAAIGLSGAAIRPRGSCAFQIEDGRVVMLVEPSRTDHIPNPTKLAETVRRTCGLLPDLLHIVPPGTVLITTSGKIARTDTRTLFLSGTVKVLATYRNETTRAVSANNKEIDWRTAIRHTFCHYGISSEEMPLAELGVQFPCLNRNSNRT